MRVRTVLFLQGAVLLTACAGGIARLGTVDRTIGRATLHDIMEEVPYVLQQHGYAIYENRPTASTLYIETGWQDREPFDDEAKEGAEYARTRFIARGRKDGPATYSLTISAENQVMASADTGSRATPVSSSAWCTIRPTRMYQAYVREITTEIQMKVDAGVRTYDVELGRPAPPPITHSAGRMTAGRSPRLSRD